MSPPPPLLERQAAGFLEAREIPGLVAALVQEGAGGVWGFGRVAVGSAHAPQPDTVFEIGSVTKVFTATLLARMAEQGRLAIDQPIRPLLPDAVRPRDWGGREVTLLHLATHTSTLPRVSGRMLMKGLLHPDNPYRTYALQDLYADVGRFRPGAHLGRKVTYSNLGFGLLGHLLSVRAGRDFEALLADEVCRPLGLADTGITLSGSQRARLATGYRRGRPAGLWDLPTIAGAGALRSTGADMVTFLQVCLGARESVLAPALREGQRQRVRASAELAVGLAWHLVPGDPQADRPRIVWHNGETGGMRSFVGLVPERGLGLALLANAAVALDELAFLLLRGL